MTKMNVLLLGWDFPPVVKDGLGAACYGISKALANRVNLSLILPKSDPEFILKNVDLTGLNNLDLKNIKPVIEKPGFSTFSEAEYVQQEIQPYGASVKTGPELVEEPKIELPGEAASVGVLGSEENLDEIAQNVEELQIFGHTDLSLIDSNSQVIHFARYASRFASYKPYDAIYAYDWRTYLAGIELKLVSGKPLVIHVSSLSEDRGGPDSRGWVYELEKQALEKCDYVIAVGAEIAAGIEEVYKIAPSKIKVLELDIPEEAETSADDDIANEIFNMEVSESNNEEVKTALAMSEAQQQDWEEAGDEILEILRKVTYESQEV
ncbi:glycosyltransferase family 4 protein [Adhaeribacter aquaticus]|uniref:glycosyltransferase family 4 protein n=1 Tax=Adhaeribacter aquaticus TaxID=299567 RepID=UPI000478EBE4|nr:glycosyltransferase family 4 protein [Adhaeribacter aquaticus]